MITMEMPLNEVIDRYSILLLKKERLPANEALAKECARFETNLARCPDKKYMNDTVASLKEVNGKIWDLESDIRKGKEGELGLEEVGRRAIAIRDLNAERIRLKNIIARKEGEFGDIKIDHASEV
ncbi:MAG: hypothetical protein Q8R25_00275 [bacterium]|nr:hypothetical protein [bacterium]